MGEKLFIPKDIKIDGVENTYQGNGIYEFDTNTENKDAQARNEYIVNQLKANGAVVVPFENINAVERSVNSILEAHKAKKEALLTTDRYNDYESERVYQLQQLEEQLEKDITEVQKKYAETVALQEKEVANKAISAVDANDQNTELFINQTVNRLLFSDNPLQELQLLKIKVSAMADEKQLATVLNNGAKLLEAVKGDKEAEEVVKEIVKMAKASDKQNEYNLQLQMLQALKRQTITAPYDNYKRAIRNKKSGDII